MATPPADQPFPFPFKAGFEDEKLLATPKYFSDQGGAFEVVQRDDQQGNCLRQVITRKTIEWEGYPIYNQTLAGDTAWTNYSFNCDVFFPEPYSYATILSRANEMHRSHKIPDAYRLILHSSGKWEFLAGTKSLASGLVVLNKNSWHSLQLDVKGNNIQVMINSKILADITDSTYTHGLVGLGCSFHRVDFDNVHVR